VEQDLFSLYDERETESFIIDAWDSRQSSHAARKRREAEIQDIIEGNWSVKLPDGKVIRQQPLVENMVVSGIEDVMRLGSSVMPTLRVEAPTEAGTSKALQREQVISYYWQLSRLRVKLAAWYRDLARGLAVIKVWPDFSKPIEERFPIFHRLDPRGVIPPPNWQSGEDPVDILCSKVVKARYLKARFPECYHRLTAGTAGFKGNEDVEVVDFYSDDMILAAARFSGKTAAMYSYENRLGVNPVVLVGRDSASGLIASQFDHAIPPMIAQNRMLTYIVEYADQMVYAPIIKKNIQGPIDFGPGAIIDAGQDGEVSRVSPAAGNPQVFQVIADLERYARRSGQTPEARSGDVRQSIASAQFVTAIQGGLTSVVENLQVSFADGLERANHVAQVVDREFCDVKKSIEGLSQGGQFRMHYTPSQLLKEGNEGNIVSYGVGAGLEAFNRIVTIIQLLGSGLVSKRWAMENIPGIDNPLKEENRMFSEGILQMLIQVGLSKAAQGDDSALRGLVELNEDNENLLEVARKVLEGAEAPVPDNVVPIDAAAQNLAMQKGATEVPQAPGVALPPLTNIQVG
jgi:hypothetical protein